MEPSVFQGSYPVIRKVACAKQTFDFTIHCPDIAKAAQAGQFVHVKADSFTLRRPISRLTLKRGISAL